MVPTRDLLQRCCLSRSCKYFSMMKNTVRFFNFSIILRSNKKICFKFVCTVTLGDLLDWWKVFDLMCNPNWSYVSETDLETGEWMRAVPLTQCPTVQRNVNHRNRLKTNFYVSVCLLVVLPGEGGRYSKLWRFLLVFLFCFVVFLTSLYLGNEASAVKKAIFHSPSPTTVAMF